MSIENSHTQQPPGKLVPQGINRRNGRRVHSDMQVWTEIRRKVLVEKVSVRQICRDYGLSHHTVAKMLENVEPPGYQQGQGERPRPKLGPFLGVIDQILEVDKTAPKKQRHTAKRVFERLRDEHGYQGSESHVRRYLGEIDHRHREVFVPLSQPPGEAQFDFGEAVVEIAGTRRKAALAAMSLPYSDAFFVTAYPRECTETFQKAHDDSFEFFGAVPTKIAYEYVPRNIFGVRHLHLTGVISGGGTSPRRCALPVGTR
jgi:transposase